MLTNWYDILKLSPTATNTEIGTALRRTAENRILTMTECEACIAELLSTPEARQNYDLAWQIVYNQPTNTTQTNQTVATEPAATTETESTMTTKPVAETKPTTELTPTDKAKPITKAKPATETKPAAELTPTDEARPITKAKPATETKPAAELTPTNEARPITKTKPAAETKPATELTPTDEARPVTKAKPAAKTKPAVASKPVTAIKLAAESKPDTTANKEKIAIQFPTSAHALKESQTVKRIGSLIIMVAVACCLIQISLVYIFAINTPFAIAASCLFAFIIALAGVINGYMIKKIGSILKYLAELDNLIRNNSQHN